jgi:hypothetical protein
MVVKMIKVTLSLGGTLAMANWCDECCTGIYNGRDRSCIWYFELEEDAMAFKLKWS